MRTAEMWHIVKTENRRMNPLRTTISAGEKIQLEKVATLQLAGVSDNWDQT